MSRFWVLGSEVGDQKSEVSDGWSLFLIDIHGWFL